MVCSKSFSLFSWDCFFSELDLKKIVLASGLLKSPFCYFPEIASLLFRVGICGLASSLRAHTVLTCRPAGSRRPWPSGPLGPWTASRGSSCWGRPPAAPGWWVRCTSPSPPATRAWACWRSWTGCWSCWQKGSTWDCTGGFLLGQPTPPPPPNINVFDKGLYLKLLLFYICPTKTFSYLS